MLAASAGIAQVAGSHRRASGAPAAEHRWRSPATSLTVQVEAIARDLKPTGADRARGADDARRGSKAPTSVVSTFYLAQDLSRQEILSTDFVLPAGTVLLHRAGDKAYVVADPRTKTYAVMDAETLLAALEGGAGIVNSQYAAKVVHTDERKTIAGAGRPARAS